MDLIIAGLLALAGFFSQYDPPAAGYGECLSHEEIIFRAQRDQELTVVEHGAAFGVGPYGY